MQLEDFRAIYFISSYDWKPSRTFKSSNKRFYDQW